MASSTQLIRRRRARQDRVRHQRRWRRFWTSLFSTLFVVFVVLPLGTAFGWALSVYTAAANALPPVGQDLATALQANAAAQDDARMTEFYDRNGIQLLYRARDPLSTGTWVNIDTLPPYVIDATLLSEDPDFFSETRFNAADMLFDLWRNALIATLPPDASITGRLVRNAVLLLSEADTGDDNDLRSREIALVAEINRRYTPRQILEWHLNTNYYGSDAYGIEAAAQTYFGKRAVDLTLDEAALLAAIPTAPQYNPFDDDTAARGRQRDLLRLMYNRGRISEDQFNAVVNVQTVIRPGATLPQIAPEYVVYARRQAERILTHLGRDGTRLVARGGLRITTALDVDLYVQADCALKAHLARLNDETPPPAALDGRPCIAAASLPPLTVASLIGDTPEGQPPDQGAIVVLDARTGELRALVGSALSAIYQPGITLQPFVYFEGFNGGLGGLYTPATMVLDIPQQFPATQEGLIFTVANPDGRFRGPMNLRSAMGAGLYPPAASLAYRQGMTTILRTAHLTGLNSLDENSASLMLLESGGAVSPLDIAYSYSVFAALGDMRGVPVEPLAFGYRGRDPVAVLQIEDAEGNLLWAYDRESAAACRTLDFCTPLMDKGLAYLVNDVLADAETRWPVQGRDTALDLSRLAAVTNGQTSDRVDNWTAGYTPQIVTVVHLGRADRAAMNLPPFALDGAAPVWRAIMEYVHARDAEAPTGWTRPPNIIEARVCDISGLAPNGVCPTYTEIFLEGTQPRVVDTYWQVYEINNQTGQLATANTPAALRTEARYFVPPEEALDWWRANNQPLPPTEIDTVSIPQQFRSVRITTPEAFGYVGGVVEIRGQINATDLQFYQLAYGRGLNPAEWISIGETRTSYTRGDPLGTWDTTHLDGLYSLRLVLTRNDNSVESDVIQVTVDNVPPTILLDTSEPGKIHRWPTDSFVEVVATATDNFAIDRVEFYHNGDLLGADENWPYSFRWEIDGAGAENFSAVVYDAVGNQASADLTVEILRAGS